jgi:hypothetical protein
MNSFRVRATCGEMRDIGHSPTASNLRSRCQIGVTQLNLASERIERTVGPYLCWRRISRVLVMRTVRQVRRSARNVTREFGINVPALGMNCYLGRNARDRCALANHPIRRSVGVRDDCLYRSGFCRANCTPRAGLRPPRGGRGRQRPAALSRLVQLRMAGQTTSHAGRGNPRRASAQCLESMPPGGSVDFSGHGYSGDAVLR